MPFVAFVLGVVAGLVLGFFIYQNQRNSLDKRFRKWVTDIVEAKLESFYERLTRDLYRYTEGNLNLDILGPFLERLHTQLADTIRQEFQEIKNESSNPDSHDDNKESAPLPVEIKVLPLSPRGGQFFVNDTSRVTNFLGTRNIAIKVIPEINKSMTDKDRVLDKIAVFMGDRYLSIRKLYEQIKSHMNSGQNFSMCLREEPQVNISNMCQLGKALHEIAFLEEYRYLRSPQYLLLAKPSRIPDALNFFAGQWLERYIRAKFVSMVADKRIEDGFAFLANPQIVLPNGDDFELDLLLEIAGEIYWFEAKTGDYQRHIDKYGRVRPILGVDSQRAFMVLLDVKPEIAQTLSSMSGLSVINIDNVQETLASIIHPYECSGDVSAGFSSNL